jgi:hypothetical protein
MNSERLVHLLKYSSKTFLYLLILVLLVIAVLFIYKSSTSKNTEQAKKVPSIYRIDNTNMTSRTMDRHFEVYENGSWNKMFLKGTNIGSSIPGKWFTEFPADPALYRSWLEDIGKMNLNMIRLYTLFDPSFYQVLKEYNEDPTHSTIWLIQEIWPDDFVPGCNFHNPTYKSAYKQEVKQVINALHGNLEQPGRAFRAYGNYSADVSPYVLGVLIGREFEPEEVENTNKKSPEYTNHNGIYVKINEGTPTEVWLAELCDFTMSYTQNTYKWQYPVGFVSWPTLDPLTHHSEREPLNISAIPAYNDREEVRPDRFFKGSSNLAGFFGAYHIYPNFPDFMNNEPDFAKFIDKNGSFHYIGYLSSFMAIHPPYPAVVAEFGISTSLNTAHMNPDGFHHGGLSEADQGPMIARMVTAIKNEGYAGSIIFAWVDEWAKKTWNTEPYMIPWDRHVSWKNAMDPEQNYGIVAAEPDHIPFTGASYKKDQFASSSNSTRNTTIKALEKDVDEAFLYLAITLENMPKTKNGDILWEEIDLYIGIDTAKRDAGEFKMPIKDLPKLPTGIEFLLHIQSPEDTSLLVIPSYNRSKFRYSITASDKGVFEEIKAVVNRERITLDKRIFPALISDQSVLRYGQFDPKKQDYNSLAHWYIDAKTETIYMRLPWMLLGFTDPSTATVINDVKKYVKDPDSANFLTAFEKCSEEMPDYTMDAAEDMEDWNRLDTEKTDGVLFYVVTYNKQILDFQPRITTSFEMPKSYMWKHWEEPSYRYRLKTSYPSLADFFRGL